VKRPGIQKEKESGETHHFVRKSCKLRNYKNLYIPCPATVQSRISKTKKKEKKKKKKKKKRIEKSCAIDNFNTWANLTQGALETRGIT